MKGHVVIATGTVAPRPLLQSVGLVCTCGRACAGIEGVVTCRGCGRIYSISVMELGATSTRNPA